MTIALGLRCSDGVILCADRELRAEYNYKYSEPRVDVIHGMNWVVAFAYSGYPRLWKGAKAEIERRLNFLSSGSDVSVTVESVLTACRNTFRQMGRLDTRRRLLQMLVAIHTSTEGADLFLFDGKHLDTAEDFNCLGVGDSALIRYLQKSLFHFRFHTDIGIPLAIYVVKQAKNHIPGCGDKTDVVVVEHSGRWEWVPARETANIEMGVSLHANAAFQELLGSLTTLPKRRGREKMKLRAEAIKRMPKNLRD